MEVVGEDECPNCGKRRTLYDNKTAHCNNCGGDFDIGMKVIGESPSEIIVVTGTTRKQKPSEDAFVARTLRVFVSYSHEDGRLASALKSRLERFGLNVFLAHVDIKPSLEWQEEILRTLKRSDIFIPLLTENFVLSEWTDQETGIAVSEQKYIIPLSTNVIPYGFIAKYQKLDFKPIVMLGDWIDCDQGCKDIINVIISIEEFKEQIKEGLISSFVKSGTFREAGEISDFLGGFDNFSAEQIREIIRGIATNRQINDSDSAKPFVKKFLSNYNQYVDASRKERIKQILERLSLNEIHQKPTI